MKDRVLHSNTLQIKLSASQTPKLTVDWNGYYVRWGKDNKYPTNKLLYWFENNALHGAICKGKARYLSGTKIVPEQESELAKVFLNKANALEDWHTVRKKCELDKVICGGWFLKVVTNAVGTPIGFYHLDFAKCRITECQNFVMYSNDWDDFNEPRHLIPMYADGRVGTSVYVYKGYAPSGSKLGSTYPKPEYESCAQEIDTDTKVSVFFNAIVKNGFSAGTIVTIKNGVKDPKIQDDIAKKLKNEHAGEENAGKPVIIFTDKDGNPTEVVSLNPNDLDKQYQEVGKRNQQNIISGHGVNGILFKIKTEGQLGGRTEIIEAHEQFLSEYVKVEQVPFNKMLSKWFYLRTGQYVEFGVEQVQPIGLELDLTNSNIIAALNTIDPKIVPNYIIEKYALKLPESVSSNGVDLNPVQQVNDNLKGLSAADNADMYRIVRDFSKGKLNEALALHRLSAYGLDTAKAKEILGIDTIEVKQSQDKTVKFIELFNKYSHEIQDDEVISVENVKFNSHSEAVKFNEAKKIEALVLEQLKGNPDQSEKTISKVLGISEELVIAAIVSLVALGLINSTKDFTPTEKGLKKQNNFETEVYTEYTYGLRDDQKGTPIILPTTRQFCKDMVSLTRTRAISFEQIQNLENDLGESVWDFKGGFYNDGTETTPWCRHVWKAVTKIRRR